LSVPLSLAGSFATESNLGRGFALSAALAIAFTLGSALVLLIGRYTVLRGAPNGTANPWVALAVFALAGAIRPVVGVLIGSLVGLDIPLDALRLVQAAFAGLVGLIAAAVVLDVYDRHKVAIADLEHELEQLDRQRAESQATLSKIARSIDSNVVSVMRAELVVIRDGLRRLQDSDAEPALLRRGAAAIVELNEEVVRPLSHSLYRSEDVTDGDVGTERAPGNRHYFQPRFSDQVDELFLISPFHPVAMPLVFGGGSIFIAVSGIGWVWGMISVILGCLVLGAGLAMSSRIFNFNTRKRLSPGMRALAVICAVVVSTLASICTTAFVAAQVDDFDPVTGVAGFMWSALLWILFARGSSSYFERVRAIGMLEATGATRQWELDALNLEVRELRAKRGSYLHGKVQSRLTLIAVHLRRTASTVEATGPDTSTIAAVGMAVDELNSLIDAIDEMLGEVEVTSDIAASLESIRVAWQGIVAIDYVGTELIAERVIESRALGTVLVEVVAEAVTNAAKHANARTITVTFDVASDGLRLCAEDDGRGVGEPVPEPESIKRMLGPDAQCAISNRDGGGARLDVTMRWRHVDAMGIGGPRISGPDRGNTIG